MKPDDTNKNRLIRRYLAKQSYQGTFARARSAWRNAIRDNRW